MVALTVLLSLATAATWALTTQFQRKGLDSVDGRTGALEQKSVNQNQKTLPLNQYVTDFKRVF